MALPVLGIVAGRGIDLLRPGPGHQAGGALSRMR